MYSSKSLISIALSFLNFVHLFASANPTPHYNLPNTNSKGLDVAIALSSTILPRADIAAGTCVEFKVKDGILSASCEVQRDDAGPPDHLQTSIELSKCMENEAGKLVYKTK
jgi:hypothetical protein